MNKNSRKKDKKIKAIFFDFGGTLMDSESDITAHVHMMKDIAKKYNLSSSPEEMAEKYHSFIFTKNMTLQELDSRAKSFSPLKAATNNAVRKMLLEYHVKPSEKDMHWFSQIYFSNHKKYVKLFPETLDVIKKIRNTDSIHIGIISDIDIDYQKFQFDAFGISHLFDSITTSEEVQSYKPEKMIFHSAFKKADCQGENAIMIGDSYEKDIVGGKNMGMTTIWLNRFYGKNAAGIKADYIVSRLKDINPFINELI